MNFRPASPQSLMEGQCFFKAGTSRKWRSPRTAIPKPSDVAKAAAMLCTASKGNLTGEGQASDYDEEWGDILCQLEDKELGKLDDDLLDVPEQGKKQSLRACAMRSLWLLNPWTPTRWTTYQLLERRMFQ